MSQQNQNALIMARGQLEQYRFELQKSRILVSKSAKLCSIGSVSIIRDPKTKLANLNSLKNGLNLSIFPNISTARYHFRGQFV